MPRGTTREPEEGAGVRTRFRFDPRVEALEPSHPAAALDFGELLARLRHRRGPALFDSASGAPRRFSLLAFDPLPAEPPTTLAGLRAFLERLEPSPTAATGPLAHFAGGFLGALAYEAGVAEERLALPPDPWGWPPIVGGLYVDYLLRDHERGTTWLVLGHEPGDGRPPVAERRAALLAALSEESPQGCGVRALGPLRRLVDAATFEARVDRVREEIARGEIYQANLSHRLEAELEAHPVDLYHALRAENPGPYLGFLGLGDPLARAILAASPELLLDHDPTTGVARTRPIKGTAPRDADPARDRAAARALERSAKDRAELAMIVDLERNDLGRVARTGSVRTGPFPALESYATVHHLVTDVSAEVPPAEDGREGLDVLAALFPGGSVTGAPKLRSMEVIAELEGEGRGYAYGSLLLADLRGRVLANLLIRTVLWRAEGDARRGRATFRIGGGITWRSEAAAEERETRHKGAALARALGAELPAPSDERALEATP